MKNFWIIVLGLILSSCIKEKRGEELAVGDRLPDFEVVMNDGSVVNDEILSDGVSVVMFFHTSCPDCQQALPLIQQLYSKYSSQGIRFALISREEDDSTVSSYWKENAFTMPYSAQSTREIYNLFAQTRVPRIYISEKGGIIKAIYTDDPVPGFEELDQKIISVCGNGTE